VAEASGTPARSFLSKLKTGDGRPGEVRKWLNANWGTMLMLLLLFFLALFVRAYYGYSMSVDNGYIVSGGSDSYYWRRIIDHSVDTGQQLYWDDLSNYPYGIRNPRPPFFSMMVAVPSVLAQGLFDSLDDSVGWFFIWSTAFWGAATIIPTYFMGKEAFGKRAGLVAAFLLALMPSHVQRSVASEADHDSFLLFFIVLTFYFLLKAVKTQQHRKWVENWKSTASVKAGFKDYFVNSRAPVLYSMMAGVAFAALIMAWVGFAYVTVIILAYYIIQILLNKFKNFDSMSVTIIITIALGLGFLLSFPVYYYQSLIPVRFDVPVYLFLAAIAFGSLFVVTRDLPWTVALPSIGAIAVIAVVGISILNPALGDAILSGQGYFVKSKLYSTIAEARAPVFSELALSFGMVTFFLSLAGLIWAIIKIPKKAIAEYIFMVVWLGASIFMAISAGRFMFNAAPAFAISAGWVIVIIIGRLDFNTVRKTLAGASGSYWQVFKKGVKIRHVVGALFLAFLIVLPNVWYSVDAGIPQESKLDFDKQIYYSMPEFLRPADYDKVNGSMWYLGAFGYTLPLPKYYFPASWDWFAQQDNLTLPESERPAYVSWWDYGFEAIQEGQHPTVADNFQNGYQLTGNVILSQNETEAIAIFAYRLLEVGMKESEQLKQTLESLMDSYGLDHERMKSILQGDAKPLIDEVLADPIKFGPMSSDLSAANARIVLARYELANLGTDKLVSFYSDVCDLTGWSIRYFSVDSRMFPKSGTDTGIFYAPCKLTDRNIVSGSIPIDYYDIKAVDSSGIEHDLADVTADMAITDYKIVYTDMFYKSMFYRAMGGLIGSDIGLANEGIPGYTGGLSQYQSMPGWNMTHFRMVYRTAYYNPYPLEQLGFHRDAWQAISLDEAVVMKAQVEAGNITGYVDDSAYTFYGQGVVFLKYYDGAFVNGTLTTEQGYPVAGVRVTIQDEYEIPHDTTVTDAQGHYSLLSPFGQVKLIFSTGSASNPGLVGANTIQEMVFNVTDEQAMRTPVDMDGDGIHDYIITKDFQMRGTEVTGRVFWDLDGDGNYTATKDSLIPDSIIRGDELFTGQHFQINATDGTMDTFLPPGQYNFYTYVYGTNMTMAEKLNVTAGAKAQIKLAQKSGNVFGHVTMSDGTPAEGMQLVITDMFSGSQQIVTTTTGGNYSFDRLIGSGYNIASNDPEMVLFNVELAVTEGEATPLNITAFPGSSLKYTMSFPMGGTAPYSVFMLSNYYDPSMTISGTSDEFGTITFSIPEGLWTLYGQYYGTDPGAPGDGTRYYAGATLIDTRTSDSQGVLKLQPANAVTVYLRTPFGVIAKSEYVIFETSSGARIPMKTDQLGMLTVRLPAGNYTVSCSSTASKAVYSGKIEVQSSKSSYLFKLREGVLLQGSIWMGKDIAGVISDSDLGAFAEIGVTDSGGILYTAMADADGSYSIAVPADIQVTIRLGNDGYSQWSQTSTFASDDDTSGLGIVVVPDDVAVTGRLTYEGAGIMGITIAFLPDSFELDPVYVTTQAGGYYTAYVPPSTYEVVVNQDTNLVGGERYMFEEALELLPTGSPELLDIAPVKKVEMYGFVSGAASNLQLRLVGPEELDLNLTSLNYSVWVLPGYYNIYAKGVVGTLTYANMTSAVVTADTREQSVELVRAYAVSGRATVSGSSPAKAVSITAVSSTGGVAQTKTSSSGFFSVDLPTGQYSISFLLEDTKVVGSRSLYVEYYSSVDVQVVDRPAAVTAALLMRLDNMTFSGNVFGATGSPAQAFIQLTANSRFGMSSSFLTSPSGDFSVEVQPGDYTMYATRLDDKTVALSGMTLVRNVPREQRIDLTAGRTVNGLVTVAGSGAALDLTLSSGTMKLQLRSDADGKFSALLPPMNYTLASRTYRTENGLNITYSTSNSIAVSELDVFVTVPMTRSTIRDVDISWDSTLKPSTLPGEEVSYVVTVTNSGNVEDTFVLAFTGQGFDVSFAPSPVTIDFGTDNEAQVLVRVTPGLEGPAGDNTVSILVRSKSQSSVNAELNLLVNVLPVRGVKVTSLNSSEPVNTASTITKFRLNNTGNVADEFILQVSNLQALEELGWQAEIIDPDTKAAVTNISLPAYGTKELYLKFTATRSDANPEAQAYVLAYSKSNSAINTYGSVPVVLPDLIVGPGDVTVERNDISYTYDVGKVYIDLALVAAIAVLVGVMLILRKKKGLGGGTRAKGGAKK